VSDPLRIVQRTPEQLTLADVLVDALARDVDALMMGEPRQCGRQLGEAGMAKTLEAEREEWIVKALQALDRFARLSGYEEFKTEDFRWWCASSRIPAPHDHHVWGALTNRACKAGIIRFTGKYLPSASPKTHGHPVKVWTRA
jgi:hypothetical protein